MSNNIDTAGSIEIDGIVYTAIERLTLNGKEERKRDVEAAASAAYWYGAEVDVKNVVDYDGYIGLRVVGQVRPLGTPPEIEKQQQRWALARQFGEVREMRK